MIITMKEINRGIRKSNRGSPLWKMFWKPKEVNLASDLKDDG